MSLDDPIVMAVVGGIVGLWLAVAGWAILRGLMMQRQAVLAGRRAGKLAAMIDSSPAAPLLIRPDGRLEGGGTIAALFGLDALPATIGQLVDDAQQGMEAGALSQFSGAVTLAQRTAKPFDMVLKSADGSRAAHVSGAPAPRQLAAPGSALLWLSDASEDVTKLARMRQQRADAIAAFDAISALIEAAPLPMWFRDARMQIALVNHAYVAATEADSAADVIARQVELVEPVAGLSARDNAAVAKEEGVAQSRLIPVTIGGERRMMQVVDVPIADVGVAGYALDQQELDNARSEYRRFSEARRSMLDEMSAAVAEFAPDRSLRFVNQPFLRLFLLDAEWAASAPPFERLFDRLRDNGRTPEVPDFPGWRAERRGWFASPTMQEEMWRLRDGTHLRAVAQPTPDGGLLLIFEDQTEQIRLASARDTLLRVRTATFDNLFESVAVFAPDSKLHLWNQRFRKLWEVSEEYLVAHPRLDQLLEKIAARLNDPRQKNVLREMIIGATGERQQRAGRIAFADGRHFDFAAIPLPDGNALFTMVDVTDSRRIERALRERAQALEAADKVKADFLSRISYELRTPLTSIGGFAEMLDGGYGGELPDAAKGYVRAILSSSEALGKQIDTVLDLAQSEAGSLPMERRPIALARLIEDALLEMRQVAAKQNVEIVTEIKAAVGQISGDRRRLRQAFDQILAHSIAAFADPQFRPAGGRRLLIFADGDATSAQIVVSDNGPGKEQGGVQAVGLALARQLVQAHDGRFELTTRAGEGSMIALFLPR